MRMWSKTPRQTSAGAGFILDRKMYICKKIRIGGDWPEAAQGGPGGFGKGGGGAG